MSAPTKKASKPSALRALLAPLLGFGIGWGSYSLIEQYHLIDDRYIRLTHLWNLRGQRWLRTVVPEGASEALRFPPAESLDAMIRVLEQEYQTTAADKPQQQRVPFTQILRDCRTQEQMEWLSDHVSEDVPYFFIADIFHSWAELHQDRYLPSAHVEGVENSSQCLPRDAAFDSKVVSEGVWEKMLSEVLPYDVAVRVLAVLAVAGKENAKWLSTRSSNVGGPQTPAFETVVALHKKYHEELGGRKAEVVSVEEVDAATASLLCELNKARVRGKRLGVFGTPTGPYPLLMLHKASVCLQLKDHIAWRQRQAPVQRDVVDVVSFALRDVCGAV